MKRCVGNMLDLLLPGSVYLVTTNSYIRQDGALVMGRGAAKDMATRFPQVPYLLGSRIKHLSEYNVGVLTDTLSQVSLGAFQVKYHFRDDADLELIKRSTAVLEHYALKEPERAFHMNYPGIGNGRLAMETVAPIIETLPDNVRIWTLKGQNHE